MTNYEFYKDEIEKIILDGGILALQENKLVDCDDVGCGYCRFWNNCNEKRKEWLNSEYKESEIDWSKVPEGTHVWVRDCEKDEWIPRLYIGLSGYDYYPYFATRYDKWIRDQEKNSKTNDSHKYIKLDEAVDPTPYCKN